MGAVRGQSKGHFLKALTENSALIKPEIGPKENKRKKIKERGTVLREAV